VIPKAEEALNLVSRGLMTTLFAESHSIYTMSDIGLMSMLLNALSQEYNRGAEVRVRDIEEMQQLFKDAAAKLGDTDLRQNLSAIVSEKPASLELAELNHFHDRCSLLLIELHTFVEERTSESWEDSCNRDIWDFLERQAERHKIESAI